MTTWAHRFLVIPDAQKATARALVLQLAPDGAQGMFTTGLSPDGSSPPTHWISSGLIESQFAGLLGDAQATYNAYVASGGTTVTLADVQALYTAAPLGTYIRDDAEGNEQACISALGLQMIRGSI